MKQKWFTFVCVLGFIVAASFAVVTPDVYAAKGGAAKLTAPRSMPAAPAAAPSTSKAVPNTQKTTTGTNQSNAAQQQKTTTQQNAQAKQQPQQQNSSFFGSAMRNIGLFAGGMFLGSMLSSMFGFGNMGFMSELFGMLFNIIAIFVVIKLIMWAWQAFRGRRKTSTAESDDAYRRGYEAAMRAQKQKDAPYTIDVTPLQKDDRDRK